VFDYYVGVIDEVLVEFFCYVFVYVVVGDIDDGEFDYYDEDVFVVV